MTRRVNEPDNLETLLRESRSLSDAPEALIEQAIALWRTADATAAQPHTAAQPAPGKLERFVAALRFDSAGTSALALGMRSTVSPVRQLLYSVSGRDIDLRLSRPDGGGRWRVAGQVLGPDANGAAMLEADGFSARCEWNDLCEFNFDAVPAGRFKLLLQSADWEIEVPQFDLAA